MRVSVGGADHTFEEWKIRMAMVASVLVCYVKRISISLKDNGVWRMQLVILTLIIISHT